MPKPQKTIAIFDVGKTNKKVFLFNENYKKVYEKTIRLAQTKDEDGDECEDLQLLTDWVKDSLEEVLALPEFEVAAVNFTSYGASLVHIMQEGKRFLPLYNYMKPYPADLQQQFYSNYGGEAELARATASPVSGNLNSGLQLYRLKYQQPERYSEIQTSLHLPQYLSYLVSGNLYSDITSIGCHTSLWNFDRAEYHHWVHEEGVISKLAPIVAGNTVSEVIVRNRPLRCGPGLHDSSSALIPYFVNFADPFILISTGTWCISLNPFNNDALTAHELQNNGLCYLQYKGLPVKANRLFAGNEHELQTARIADHYQVSKDFYKKIALDTNILEALNSSYSNLIACSSFNEVGLNELPDPEYAYHALMVNIVSQQQQSTGFVIGSKPVKDIYVDGGFSKNPIYMHLLAKAFPQQHVYAASLAQATALGAALAVHDSWNSLPLPANLVQTSKNL